MATIDVAQVGPLGAFTVPVRRVPPWELELIEWRWAAALQLVHAVESVRARAGTVDLMAERALKLAAHRWDELNGGSSKP